VPRCPYPHAERFWSAQTTMTTGASSMEVWFRAAADSLRFVSAFLMIMNSHGWMFPADGAHLAASMSFLTSSSETSSLV